MKKVSLKLLEDLKCEFSEESIAKYTKLIKKPMKDDGKLGRVEIIVLKYKSPETEKQCLAKIIDHTTHPYKLTVYDNRPNSANTSKIWNKLIKESTCDLVCLIDSDAFVTEGWLEPLVEAMLTHQDCIMAVPVTEGSAGGEIQSRRFQEALSTDDHVSGFCFLTRKDYIEDMGWFDEDFYFYGQDSDMSYRIQDSKYKVYVCGKSLVHHGEKVGNSWSFSQSGHQAAEAKELDWNLDIRYAPLLCERKNQLRIKRKNENNTRIG